jgi:hypothetical protein
MGMIYAKYVRTAALAAGLGIAFWLGGGMEQRRCALSDLATAEQRAALQDAAIEAARADATAEAERRAEQARAMEAAASARREAVMKGRIHALQTASRPECDLPAERLHDYTDAVRAANRLAAPE